MADICVFHYLEKAVTFSDSLSVNHIKIKHCCTVVVFLGNRSQFTLNICLIITRKRPALAGCKVLTIKTLKSLVRETNMAVVQVRDAAENWFEYNQFLNRLNTSFFSATNVHQSPS